MPENEHILVDDGSVVTICFYPPLRRSYWLHCARSRSKLIITSDIDPVERIAKYIISYYRYVWPSNALLV